MDNLHGLYKGIVVRNDGKYNKNDVPAGRVLVKIDGITPSTFSENYKALPADNVGGTFDYDSVDTFEVLAYVLSPIIGESSQGIMNRTSNTTAAVPPSTSAQFTLMNSKQRGKFGDCVTKHNNPINNPYDHSYYSDHRHKAGRGVYSVPEPNSRVLVMFLEGSRAWPVVVGKLNTEDEVEAYYTSGGVRPYYPNMSQNYSRPGTRPVNNNTGTTSDKSQPFV